MSLDLHFQLSVTAGGTADALTVTLSPAIPANTDKTLIWVRSVSANATTSPTITLNGWSDKLITKKGADALLAGDIQGSGHVLELQYDSATGFFELLNPALTNVNEVSGILPLSSGGTAKNMTAINGGVVWTDANSMEVTAAGTSNQVLKSNGAAAPSWTSTPTLDLSNCNGYTETWMIACSDETSLLTTGTGKASFSFPYAVTVLGVYATVNTAPTGSTIIVDINESGVSILGTRITIDISEFTGGSAGYQGTAATAAVISDSAIAAFAQVTVDIDQIGSTVAGKGLKVALIVKR